MALRLLISFFILLTSNQVEAQLDSSKIFEKSKGALQFPISKFYQIEKYEDLIKEMWEVKPSKKTTFIADSSYDVKAIFEGVIVMIEEIDNFYIVIAKFGNYFLTYSGLTKPNLIKGNFIKVGQTISTIRKDWDDKYRLDIYLSSKKHNELDPFPWFKK